MSETVVPFARPLGWVVDLDLYEPDAKIVAAFLAQLPRKPWSYASVALVSALHLQWLAEKEQARQAIFRNVLAERAPVLSPLIGRCERLEGFVSTTGVKLVARGIWDDATRLALQRLTRDPRILQRLRLTDDHQSVRQ